MQLRPWNRLLGLLLTVIFTVSAAAPGAFHGCAMGTRMSAHLTGVPAEQHQHSHHQHTGPSADLGECHCIGHSCGSVAPVLPAAPLVVLPTVTVPVSTVVHAAITLPLIRPPFLLPQSQAPPAQV
jgi:hypothetical protein